MTILVTGANGFVGTALCETLKCSGRNVRGATRVLVRSPSDSDSIAIGDISPRTDWAAALHNVNQVVHLAARVHIMHDSCSDPFAEFRRVNVDATEALARQAAAAQVARFVYLSSIKVNGESTTPGRVFSECDQPAPADAYGVSKCEAEQVLRQIAEETGMEVAIIRPPLVYGPGVKANFEAMMRWLVRGVPLPLAGVTKNRRSLIAVDNLVDLIITCLWHPEAANRTFMASDGEDVSTADLLRRMGLALGAPAKLFYVPDSILRIGATALGKRSIYQRLCGSLQVDLGNTREQLGWSPPVKLDEGLRRAATGFRQ